MLCASCWHWRLLAHYGPRAWAETQSTFYSILSLKPARATPFSFVSINPCNQWPCSQFAFTSWFCVLEWRSFLFSVFAFIYGSWGSAFLAPSTFDVPSDCVTHQEFTLCTSICSSKRWTCCFCALSFIGLSIIRIFVEVLQIPNISASSCFHCKLRTTRIILSVDLQTSASGTCILPCHCSDRNNSCFQMQLTCSSSMCQLGSLLTLWGKSGLEC